MKLFTPSSFWSRCVVASVLFTTAVAHAQDAAPAPDASAAIPTLFVCGDSTAKNTAAGAQGWGTAIAKYFDPAKVTVANVAHAGTSSHTYYNGDWPNVLPRIKPGDYVLEVFGINDGTTPNGLGDEVNDQGVHTYGWYMSEMATEARAKGARVYLLTVTARDIWTNPKAKFKDATIISQDDGYNPADDKIERGTGNGKYTQWTKDVGTKLSVPVLDLTNLLADKYEKTGREKVMVNYLDHNHTNPAGADIVAASIISGLKAFKNSPFWAMLSEPGAAIETADAKYILDNPLTNSTVLLGQIPGALPNNPALPTIWVIGDSTVRNGLAGDGSNGQWGWGAPIEYYFDRSKINVVNRALGGTSSRSYYNTDWKNAQPLLKKGDFVIMQFGHNDKNGDFSGVGANLASLNGAGDETKDVPGRNGQTETVHTFGWYIKQYIEGARAQGATPIVCSLIPRKIWADGKIVRVNADYFDYSSYAAEAAKAENAPFVNLNEITARKYDALGEDKVVDLFYPTPSEHTHTEWYGAVINAESVIGGLKALKDDPLAAYFSDKGNAIPPADPSKPALEGTTTVQSAASAMATFAAAAATTAK